MLTNASSSLSGSKSGGSGGGGGVRDPEVVGMDVSVAVERSLLSFFAHDIGTTVSS